jgi:hypothetical protein
MIGVDALNPVSFLGPGATFAAGGGTAGFGGGAAWGADTAVFGTCMRVLHFWQEKTSPSLNVLVL